MLPRVPASISRVAAVTMRRPRVTVPNALGGSSAASAISDPNQKACPMTCPAPTHDSARTTVCRLGPSAGGLSSIGVTIRLPPQAFDRGLRVGSSHDLHCRPGKA